MKKLVWGLLLILGISLCASSVGYYQLFLRQEQKEAALKEGRHITLAIATNEIEEGKLHTIKKGDLPQKLTDEEDTTPPVISNNKTIPTPKTPALKQEKTLPDPSLPSGTDEASTAAIPVTATTTATAKSTQPTAKVALLISGLGLSKSSTERALTLPAEVTFGISPYSLDIKQWVSTATKHGNEIFINLPMETAESSVDDPGSFALATNLDAEHNLKRLDWLLSRVGGYAGVYSDANEKFTESQSNIRPILYELKKRNLAFIYGAGYGNISFLQLAKNIDQPIIIGDVAIDTTISADRIKESLEALEQSAKKNGYAVGIGAPYPITIKIVEQWLPTLKEKGIELVPASMLLQTKKATPQLKQ